MSTSTDIKWVTEPTVTIGVTPGGPDYMIVPENGKFHAFWSVEYLGTYRHHDGAVTAAEIHAGVR